MTDDDCGCKCRDCTQHDLHRCGLPACGYTAYLAKSKPVERIESADVPPILRAQFRSIQNPESRARLTEWAKFCHETAGLDPELWDVKRRERYAKIFGVMA